MQKTTQLPTYKTPKRLNTPNMSQNKECLEEK
jgi:hypothetical protein